MRHRTVIALVGLLAAAACADCLAQEQLQATTAILGAFDIEVEILESALEAREQITILGIQFAVGTLRGRRVVVARTGIGKVNAAMTTALLLDHFHPSEVIFTGIAGGINPDLLPGDIVIGATTLQHDFVAVTADSVTRMAPRNPVSGERNPVYIPGDEKLRDLAGIAGRHAALDSMVTSQGKRLPRVMEGVIATGDCFVASTAKKQELRDELRADAVEMEGAAVAQVCYQLGTPCIVIRSLSDNADESAAEDLERFYKVAAQNSARMVMTMVRLLAGGSVISH
jgi:adenosylhomocysteine nucleosidase